MYRNVRPDLHETTEACCSSSIIVVSVRLFLKTFLRCAGFPQARVGFPGGHRAVTGLGASSGETFRMPGASWGYFGGFRELIEEDVIVKRRARLGVRLRLVREEQLQIDGHAALQMRT